MRLAKVSLLALMIVLLAAASFVASPSVAIAQSQAHCANTSVGLVPLNDLGMGTYKGFTGGLYPNGSKDLPSSYLETGQALAQEVVRRNATGQPDPNGKIVLLTIGMSNTSIESDAFIKTARSDSSLNPALVIVNGAQGGMTASIIMNPNDGRSGTQFWQTVDSRLSAASVSREQVQAIWLKEADASPTGSDIAYAQKLASELQTILQVLQGRFPNLKLVYMSSRIYGGYASTGLNPEPYAYVSGFSVKWTIEAQIKGASQANPVRIPWVAWGPYPWADGTRPRSDGLIWSCSDLRSSDGTHPSDSGAAKVAGLLMTFFKNNPTTRSWFLK